MATDPIPAAGATFPTTSTATSTTKTSTSNTTMDRDAFMKLMIAQMRYQDPSKPMDNSQMLAQTAQYTSIELLQKVQQSQADLLSFQSVVLSSSLVGKTVTGTALDGTPVTGVVSSARVVSGNGYLEIGGKQIPVTGVTEVKATADAPAKTDTPGTTEPS
jgi:flagellar basal-body rod modification protein FlgD